MPPGTAPKDWYSPSCLTVCEAARKNVDDEAAKNGKKNGNPGAVYCGPDPKHPYTPVSCPCVLNFTYNGTDDKWDECPELTWCVYKHEVGHQFLTPGNCEFRDKVCPMKGDADPIDKYHKQQRRYDLACLQQAEVQINQNKSYDTKQRQRCIDMAEALQKLSQNAMDHG